MKDKTYSEKISYKAEVCVLFSHMSVDKTCVIDCAIQLIVCKYFMQNKVHSKK